MKQGVCVCVYVWVWVCLCLWVSVCLSVCVGVFHDTIYKNICFCLVFFERGCGTISVTLVKTLVSKTHNSETNERELSPAHPSRRITIQPSATSRPDQLNPCHLCRQYIRGKWTVYRAKVFCLLSFSFTPSAGI